MPKLGYTEKYITILLIGGQGVGKTTIMNRLRQEAFDPQYLPSQEHYESQFLVKLWGTIPINGEDRISLKMIDVGSELLEEYIKLSNTMTKKGQKFHSPTRASADHIFHESNHAFRNDLRSLIEHCDGFLYVIDVTNIDSLKAAQDYQTALHRNFHSHLLHDVPKVLAAHKYDRQAVEPVISSLVLDSISSAQGFSKWRYTVGSPKLLDFDPMRPAWNFQSCPEELVHSLVRLILRNRYGDKAPFPAPNEAMEVLNANPYITA
jgi:GTPase SAR1 family protein